MAPELILAVAVREWLDARELVTALRDFESDKNNEIRTAPKSGNRSIVTGFYVIMGGLQVRYGKPSNEFIFDFASSSGDGDAETNVEGYLNLQDMKEHLHFNKISLSTLISESEIRDKGKADNLIKCMLAF
jgi:hypothetical protein